MSASVRDDLVPEIATEPGDDIETLRNQFKQEEIDESEREDLTIEDRHLTAPSSRAS